MSVDPHAGARFAQFGEVLDPVADADTSNVSATSQAVATHAPPSLAVVVTVTLVPPSVPTAVFDRIVSRAATPFAAVDVV